MAYSSKVYTGDGSTTDFAVTFDYLDASHVRVRVDKTYTDEVGAGYKFLWVNDTTIRVDTVADSLPVPNGLKIELIRQTPIADPAVVFGGGVSLSSNNLNKNSEYLTYALQEATDTNEEFTKLYLGAFATAPTSDNEGETLQVGAVYYDSVASALYYWTGSQWIIGESTVAAETARDAAQTAQAAAETAETNAAASAAAASTSETNAATSETNAGTSETNAAASAAAASTSETNAAASAAVAATSETNAAASETNAAASAAAAATSETNADADAVSASASAAVATTKATEAAASAAAASSSETAAANSETNAAASAAAAATFDPAGYVPVDTVTGNVAVQGHVEAGLAGGGAVGLTVNDGGGNSNVTFNHVNQTPDQTGNAGRITVNTDAQGGACMLFSLKSGVTNGVSASLVDVLRIYEDRATLLGDEIACVGTGQIWRNKLSSRAHSTAYTNTTGKPIQVIAAATSNVPFQVKASVGNWKSIYNVGGYDRTIGVIVPDGWMYRLNGTTSIDTWWELS